MTPLEQTLEALRREFDAAFSVPGKPGQAETIRLFLLRAGGNRYAVRAAQTSGILPRPAITALPGARAELLGIAGVRGRLVPVFSLAALQGDRPVGSERWLLLHDGDEPLAFAAEAFDGQVEVAPDAISATEGVGGYGIASVVEAGGCRRGLLELDAIAASLRATEPDRTTGGDA